MNREQPPRRVPQGDYHPGNLTTDGAFRQDDAPPMSERVVTDGRPVYRKAGFRI